MELIATILRAYNVWGGALETSCKNSKQGMGLNKQNQESFHAQEMSIVLAQLAYILTTWNWLNIHPPLLPLIRSA